MLPDATANSWLQGDPNKSNKLLKAPSGKEYRVTEIIGIDNNEYVVLEGDYTDEDRKLETPTGKSFNVITVSHPHPCKKR